ncbi:MAG: hypothetical protein CME62_06395 [Halobacteriovoraceae bacterium]|nr:hypothetical protein [Halobacteriovoraceae bacterium]
MRILFFLAILTSCSTKSWREASRESIGIAPVPSTHQEEVFQIYYARAFSWKGYFAIHPWISWKEAGESTYTVAQVTTWNVRRLGSAISVVKDLPDRKWFDSEPSLLFDVRGEKAKLIIEKVKKAIEHYPYKDFYKIWPGPNSNTFVSYIIREVPEIDIELPSTAIGKNYFPGVVSSTASETGFVFSLFGLAGFHLGAAEGVGVHFLGLNFGVDLWTPAIEIPFAGRLGFPDKGF